MPLVTLLLLLQAPPDRLDHEKDRGWNNHGQFRFGPVFEYWFPRFTGKFREDGDLAPGTIVHLIDDLNLPDEAAIFMYGGGGIGGHIPGDKGSYSTVTALAEYMGHTWRGHDVLKSAERLGEDVFPGGGTVDSRFSLSTLTLDIQVAGTRDLFGGGLCLSLLFTKARLRMDSPTVHAKETIYDAAWGIGAFMELRPIPHLLAGVSAKMFLGFSEGGEGGESIAGDFRVYGAAEWGPVRLEGGYRTKTYALDQSEEELRYTLYGAYALASIIVRF